MATPLRPFIPARGFGRTRFRGRGGFQGRGRQPPVRGGGGGGGGGPKFASLRNHHEDFYDYQDYEGGGGGGRDVQDREEGERGFGFGGYDNFLNDYETSYPKQFNYNDAYRGRRQPPPPPRRPQPPRRPLSPPPPPRSQHGLGRYKDYDYDIPAEVYDGPMKAVDYQPSIGRHPPRRPLSPSPEDYDDYDDYEAAEALPNPAPLVSQKAPPAEDIRVRDASPAQRPFRPSKDYSTLYREKLKRLREFNKKYRHKDRPVPNHSPTRTIFGRDPGDAGGFANYAFGDLNGGKDAEPSYNSNFAKEPGGYNHSYGPQLHDDGGPGKYSSQVLSNKKKL